MSSGRSLPAEATPWVRAASGFFALPAVSVVLGLVTGGRSPGWLYGVLFGAGLIGFAFCVLRLMPILLGKSAAPPAGTREGDPPGTDSRQRRARAAGNWGRSVARRRSGSGKVVAAIFGGLIVCMIILPPLFPIAFFAVIGWLFYYGARKQHVADLDTYARRFSEIGGHAGLLEPRMGENMYVLPGSLPEFSYELAVRGVWFSQGAALAVRENDMRHLAAAHQASLDSCPSREAGQVVNPAITAVGYARTWQVRNLLELPDPAGDIAVHVVDVNSLTRKSGSTDGISLAMMPATVVEAWYPSSNVLVVRPADPPMSLPWDAGADAGGTGEPVFDRTFTVRTDNDEWARLMLNPAVMQILLTLAAGDDSRRISMLINNGRISVVIVGRWFAASELEGVAARVRDIVRAARAAEAS